MGVVARYDEAAIIENSAVILARLSDRLSEVSQAIQRRLATVIPELWDDSGVVELLGASVENNVDTVFHALRYEIPIENIEPPTAALEYARRMAQRGVPMNALVRAYRLGHEIVLEFARDEIAEAGMDPRMSLAVFERVTAVTFRYVDWISQERPPIPGRPTGAAAAGLVRDDIDIADVLDIAAAVAWVGEQPERDAGQRKRLLRVVVDGLRPANAPI